MKTPSRQCSAEHFKVSDLRFQSHYIRPMSISRFTTTLLRWHETENQRSMPWKGEQDPYKIWLSEIILQQTRVEQGRKYYEQFLKHYPTVFALAEASIDEVLSLWEGLGYYSRARNLHFTARKVASEFNGVFPDTYEGLVQLKGIGPYTASAIASFAFDLPHPVVDGNSLRLVSRYTGSERPIDLPSGKNWVQDFLENAIPEERAAAFNQALMDFGATICKPRQVLCHQCPFSTDCNAYKEGRVDELPLKAKKVKRKKRDFHYIYLRRPYSICIEKRIAKDIWQGLYQLPMIERPSSRPLSETQVQQDFHLPKGSAIRFLSKKQQRLTHQDITGYFYEVHFEAETWSKERDGIWVETKNLSTFGFPKLVRCFLEEKQLTLNI